MKAVDVDVINLRPRTFWTVNTENLETISSTKKADNGQVEYPL